MSDPFRDEAAAAMQRVEELEAENEELRARLAQVEGAEDDGRLVELRSEVEAAESAALALRMRLTELEAKRPTNGAWIVRFVFVMLVIGMLVGHWWSCR